MHLYPVKSVPQNLYIAFSGGVDSVVMTHKALSQNKNVTLAFFHHGNKFADTEEEFVNDFAKSLNLKLEIGRCNTEIIGSKEKFWRDSRYEFFKKLNAPVATGHNLDDAVEWYILTCLRGEGHYMEYSHANVIRPLILTSKADIVKYAQCNGLAWIDDPSNEDIEFTYRNKIRHNILPQCLEINPGLYSTVANVIRKRI